MKVIRILVYEGTEEWINRSLERSAVQGVWTFDNNCRITEVFVGVPREFDLQRALNDKVETRD